MTIFYQNKFNFTLIGAFFAFLIAICYVLLPFQYVILLTLSMLLLFVTFYRPDIIMVLGIFTICIESLQIFIIHGVVNIKYPIYAFLISLAIFASFLTKLYHGKKDSFQSLSPIHVFGLLTLLFMVQSLIWCPDLTFGIHNVILFFINFLIFCLVIEVSADYKWLNRVINVVIVSGCVAATFLFISLFYNFSERILLTETVGYGYGIIAIGERPGGLGGTDQTGGFLAACAILVLAQMFGCKKRSTRLLLSVAGLYLVVGMLATVSRGSFIGFVAGIFSFILLHREGRRRFIALTTRFVIVLVVLVVVSQPGLIDRLLVGFGYSGELLFSEKKTEKVRGSEGVTQSSGLLARMEWWREGLAAMIDRPYKLLLGLGAGGFVYYAKAPEIHSFFLAFFFDLGLLGLILLVSSFFFYVRSILKAFELVEEGSRLYPILVGTTAMVFGEVCVHGLIEYELTSMIGRFPWFYFGLHMAAVNAVFREKETRRQMKLSAIDIDYK